VICCCPTAATNDDCGDNPPPCKTCAGMPAPDPNDGQFGSCVTDRGGVLGTSCTKTDCVQF